MFRETAVVKGAIFRAWNKENGPHRFTLLSYGFGITEEYNPEWKEHAEIRPTLDKVDGCYYVRNTIDWLVRKVIDNLGSLVIMRKSNTGD
jgi:hypothetical protein